ncbi:inositol monophosphatase 1-like protein [Dinothrombium tinctorium]|uniref:Inositol-1-monophosphatase n=1 Tax=Dinothrombium tinctorium TaxID=1965070 RepID=A0A443RL25_9ACAR|nr:inositol monophosphatase 1-like protein [Dinothrombium tinctorium]
MNPQTLNECERVAINLALNAGQMMQTSSGKKLQIDEKISYADLVTETDKAIEVYVFEELRKHFPTHRFIGEETSEKAPLTDEPTWIVDPIDGTMNFVHTFPFVCISIALIYNKEPILGVVYSPFLDKLYTAKKGFGAYCNGVPLKVRECESLQKALLIFELGNARDEEKINSVFANFQKLAFKCSGMRSTGSAALNICAIANGYADGYYEFGLHCWDLAAGVIILTEAGGCAMDTEGGSLDLMSRRLLVACNESLAKTISKELVSHLKLERDD